MFKNQKKKIIAQKATPESFKKYGFVIKTNNIVQETDKSVTANQGTAIKQEHLGVISNNFIADQESSLNIHIFNCKTRELSNNDKSFHCKIMEKHPFSSQVFIPKTNKYVENCYLVIVSLEEETDENGEHVVEAFMFDSDSSVVYKAGIWHSPMCNVQPSKEVISFIVLINE
ncbi:hypothetical protein QEN19_002023 [Hanseniaspora menglaensis]